MGSVPYGALPIPRKDKRMFVWAYILTVGPIVACFALYLYLAGRR